MATKYFEVTNEWQELTGISEVSGLWTIQNSQNIDGIKIYVGVDPVPTDGRGAIVLIKGYATVVKNVAPLEKVWVKTVSANQEEPVILNISEGQ